MATKSAARKTSSPLSPPHRTFLAGVDVVKLSLVLEETDSPSYRLYVELRDKFLAHDEQAVSFFKLLDALDDAPAVVEGAMCQAGFVVGFDCCRQLLLGDLEIPAAALKGGAK